MATPNNRVTDIEIRPEPGSMERKHNDGLKRCDEGIDWPQFWTFYSNAQIFPCLKHSEVSELPTLRV